MRQVLITKSKGIIEQVGFFDDPALAVEALSNYVKNMIPDHDDAAVFDADGLIANAKHFLDDKDEYRENKALIKEVSGEKARTIYIIGNPRHRLGFMVASPDDPLGYDDPIEAVSELGLMRKDSGNHLKIYRVISVDGPIATRTQLEKLNADSEIEDFDYSLVDEFLR